MKSLAIALSLANAANASEAGGVSRNYEGALAIEDRAEQQDAFQEPTPKDSSVKSKTSAAVASTVHVAVGFTPELLGTRGEVALLDRLECSAHASEHPRAQVRRLRPGVGDGPFVCRERRDDFVVQIGTLPDRADLVVLPYDCRLARQLPVRALTALDEPGLVAALWSDHRMLVQQGARERKTWSKLGPKARTAIVASVVVVALGVAVGILLGTTLRKQEIVITVKP